MKVLVITGSPRKHGNSSKLADEFISKCKNLGIEVFRFDTAFKNIHPCIACEKCHSGDGSCAFKDDMEELRPRLIESDGVVFVSPIYYYGMNSQIKTAIDRFYACDAALHKPKKAALILSFADDTMESADGAIASFNGMINFLGWENAGIIAAKGCFNVNDVDNTSYLKDAGELAVRFKEKL